MKMTHYLLIVLTVGILALVGCGKGDSSPPPPAGLVDLGALQAAFPNPTPEVMTSIQKLRNSIRYRQYEVALMELDKLSQAPDLTEPQKKAVNTAIEQSKVAISKMPAVPPQ
jgi:hypothetical protein